MQSIRDAVARRDLVGRVERLSAASRRQWGRMELPQMLAHVADQLRIALGEIGIGRPRGPLRFAPLRYLAIYVVPWPKGKAKAPTETFTTAPTGLEKDRATLLTLIERYAATPVSELAPLHPLFGRMTADDWDTLSYKHLDHHLRQFGV